MRAAGLEGRLQVNLLVSPLVYMIVVGEQSRSSLVKIGFNWC